MNTILALVAVACGGALSGYYYSKSMNAAYTEDTIGREVRLLTKYAETPSCEEARAKPETRVAVPNRQDKVYWRYSGKSHLLKKVVVTPDLFIAYEEVPMDCGQ